MTCIIGYLEKGKVWIGSDSAGVAGYNITTREDRKVFIRNNVLFGFCGSFRMGQLLNYRLSVPKQGKENDLEYLSTSFIDSVRQCLKDGGHSSIDKNVETINSSFILGYKNNLYEVESDYQVAKTSEPYCSVGCGSDIALGALYILKKSEVSPKIKIKAALEASERFSCGVRRPFHIISSDNETFTIE